LSPSQNNFNIDKAESAAVEQANIGFSVLVPLDLNQQPRPTLPAAQADLGAYQAIEISE
jgi:hypothetical protein